MAIPDFQALTLPVLKLYADENAKPSREVRDAISAEFQLSEQELAELLPSGRQTRFGNRVAWAHSHLKQAALIESPARGVYKITARGKELLNQPPPRLDIAYLMRYPEFVDFRTRGGAEASDVVEANLKPIEELTAKTLTPDEQIREGNKRLRETLAAELLQRVQAASPRFFEVLVVELLVAMGYGGTHADAASVVGRSGDGGIDGVIKEDRLGFDSIYVQAKRWQDTQTVGRPEIQQFAGALQGQRARKGVFITTAKFSKDATAYAAGLQTTIVLIDGDQLGELMLDHGVGVNVEETIRLLKIDEDYFLEE